MKIFAVVLIALLFSVTNCFSQTQTQLTESSANDLKITELKMDSVFKKIQMIYAKDITFIKNIKLSQHSWNTYYLNQINTMFPKYPSDHHYGSMLSMCVTSYSKKLVALRIQELEQWLIGREDGDCLSSIKPKDELPAYTPYRSEDDIP